MKRIFFREVKDEIFRESRKDAPLSEPWRLLPHEENITIVII